ncbi:MAG: adenosylcobinamide-GDP ribazoletransferase, partial [Sulfurovum sp.]|nr:adenosylcobinamide-GDP ribazoletransferase [Sulfurovaceae bacterium]
MDIRNLYLGFKFSLSYFSILPLSFNKNINLSSKEILNIMVLSLPLVGAILGLITVVIYLFIEYLEWYGAVMSAIIYMMLYGFIHTEAVLDVADAIYASHGDKDAYKIIKEPIVGAMGVLYAIALIIAKIAGITYLFLNNLFIEFIIIVVVSRLSLVILFQIHTFRSSFATQLKESINKKYFFISLIFYILIFSYIGIFAIITLFIGILLSIRISFWIKQRVGFVNGDVLGA